MTANDNLAYLNKLVDKCNNTIIVILVKSLFMLSITA